MPSIPSSKHRALQEAYLTLGIAPPTDWSQIKYSYRKLAQKNHPDRFIEGSSEHQQAINNFHALQAAYRTLMEHHQKPAKDESAPPLTPPIKSESFSKSPLETSCHSIQKPNTYKASSFSTSTHSAFANPSPTHTSISAQAPQSRQKYLGWALISIFVGTPLYLLLNKNQAVFSDGSIQKNSQAADKASSTFGFNTGDDLQTVLGLQGEPSRIEGNIWFYGESRVIFSQGKVIDWQNSQDTPLKIR